MNPSFLDPEVDYSDDESGYTWDFDRDGDLGYYGDDEEEEGE